METSGLRFQARGYGWPATAPENAPKSACPVAELPLPSLDRSSWRVELTVRARRSWTQAVYLQTLVAR
jgi:hypothetical protein